MNSLRIKFTAGMLVLLLAVQLLVPGQASAAPKVMDQLPEPEWSYKLPAGYRFSGPLNIGQTKDHKFFPLVKTVKLSNTKEKSTRLVYASISRGNKPNAWIYDYSDIVNDTIFSGSETYYGTDGYSYFYKKVKNQNKNILSAVDPKGKLKWTKTIDDYFKFVMLDNNHVLLSSIGYSSEPGGSPRFFIEYDHNGKVVRNLSVKSSPLMTGSVDVLPNGFVMHSADNKTLLYRSLDNLKAPLLQSNSRINVMPFSGGSFLVQPSDTKAPKIIGYDANGKKKWVRALNTKDRVLIVKNNYLIYNDLESRLYSKDNQLLGKQQLGEMYVAPTVAPSGEIAMVKLYQWQERPEVLDENFKGDVAQEDFYVLDPENLQIKYHLSTKWADIEVGHDYLYAGNGELYIKDFWYQNKLSKYMLK